MKFALNDVFKRDGGYPLRIVGFTHDGKYLLNQVLRARSNFGMFPHECLIEGANLRLPNGRIIKLVHLRDTGYWETTYPNDEIILSEEELEQMAADKEASAIYHEVATRREFAGITRRLHFLAKKIE